MDTYILLSNNIQNQFIQIDVFWVVFFFFKYAYMLKYTLVNREAVGAQKFFVLNKTLFKLDLKKKKQQPKIVPLYIIFFKTW